LQRGKGGFVIFHRLHRGFIEAFNDDVSFPVCKVSIDENEVMNVPVDIFVGEEEKLRISYLTPAVRQKAATYTVGLRATHYSLYVAASTHRSVD
jgi:hypothetical protein